MNLCKLNLRDFKPSATNALILCNVLVTLLQAIRRPLDLLLPSRNSLIDMGANFGVLTIGCDYWRVLTSMYVHVGVIHLAINMFALYSVGTAAESLFGWRIFLLIYLYSGVMASLTSTLHDPLGVSAGASGAILGVYGSLLAFMYVHRDRYPQSTLRYHAQLAVGLLVLSVIYSFIVPGIDNYAHAGGFIAGGFAGVLLARIDVRERWRASYALPVMALLVVLWSFVVHDNFQRHGFDSYLAGLQALRAKDYGGAIAAFSKFIERNGDEPLAYGSRALAYSQLNRLPEACSDFEKVIALSPQSAEAYNSLARVEVGRKQYALAVAHATTSLQLNPRSTATYDTRGYALAHLGQTDKALADFAKGLQYDPRDSACHYHRMKLYESLGRKAEAAQDQSAAAFYKPDTWETISATANGTGGRKPADHLNLLNR